jgi:hypothetical protein
MQEGISTVITASYAEENACKQFYAYSILGRQSSQSIDTLTSGHGNPVHGDMGGHVINLYH